MGFLQKTILGQSSQNTTDSRAKNCGKKMHFEFCRKKRAAASNHWLAREKDVKIPVPVKATC
jgi:hypothetical protein